MMKNFSSGAKKLVALAVLLFLVLPGFSQDTINIADLKAGLDTVFVLVSAFLVFFMQAGFGMVEAGFIRSKNTTNILTKNFMDFCMASLGYFLFGYAIMFGAGNGFFGTSGFFMVEPVNTSGLPIWAFWLFQAAFTGAAATIVAGGMAGRMKFQSYLIYSFIISAFIYPIVGNWGWNGGFTDAQGVVHAAGWLNDMGFSDFAGSAIVHTTGGVAALIGTMMLGPRAGKYKKDGSVKMIAGHNIPLAALGVFILWFGWFGFNPGSALSVGNGDLIAKVAMNTSLAAAMGGIGAIVLAWVINGKPDLAFAMNGALAGLVAITAPCNVVDPWAAMVIGAVGGILVVLATLGLDKIKIDDPVGAFPVHGVNGIWGTLAVGLFAANNGLFTKGSWDLLGVQAIGVFSIAAFVASSMSIVLFVIDKTVGLRVPLEEEIRGLDIVEHGMESYAGFQIID
jgi:Amt family ammonium transporter